MPVGQDQFTEVAHVRRAPTGALAGAVTVAQQEGLEPLLGAREVIGGIGAGAAHITDGFVAGRRNADRSEIPVAEELGEFLGVALVGPDLLVGLALGLGGSDHDAFQP